MLLRGLSTPGVAFWAFFWQFGLIWPLTGLKDTRQQCSMRHTAADRTVGQVDRVGPRRFNGCRRLVRHEVVSPFLTRLSYCASLLNYPAEQRTVFASGRFVLHASWRAYYYNR